MAAYYPFTVITELIGTSLSRMYDNMHAIEKVLTLPASLPLTWVIKPFTASDDEVYGVVVVPSTSTSKDEPLDTSVLQSVIKDATAKTGKAS